MPAKPRRTRPGAAQSHIPTSPNPRRRKWANARRGNGQWATGRYCRLKSAPRCGRGGGPGTGSPPCLRQKARCCQTARWQSARRNTHPSATAKAACGKTPPCEYKPATRRNTARHTVSAASADSPPFRPPPASRPIRRASTNRVGTRPATAISTPAATTAKGIRWCAARRSRVSGCRSA